MRLSNSSDGFVDLHCHSYASSDGAGYPAEMARYFKQAGFKAFSLTDHATFLGQKEARMTAAEVGIEFVPGVEITAIVDDSDLPTDQGADILCFDYQMTPEVEALAVREGLFLDTIRRFIGEMRAKGQLDFGVEDFEHQVQDRYGERGVAHWPGIQRETLGELLIARRMIDLEEGRKRGFGTREWSRQATAEWLRDYNQEPDPTPLDHACRVMRAAGAVLILAHPGQRRREPGDEERKRIHKWLDDYVDGVEVFHHRNSPDYRRMLLEIVEERGRPYTGGGDRHHFPGDGGIEKVPLRLDRIKEWNAGPAKLHGHISEAPANCLDRVRTAGRR